MTNNFILISIPNLLTFDSKISNSMKLILLLISLVITIKNDKPVQPTAQCNSVLMESYDLDSQLTTVSDDNLICPQAFNNCCSYATQLNIYKKWIIKEEKKHIFDFYSKFSKIFERIFIRFSEIEVMAESIEETTSFIQGSNCNKYAKTIMKYKISEMKEEVAALVKRTYQFLFQSRQGFYCSLCDADQHKHFNLTATTFNMDYGFCSSMVDNTLNFYLFRYKFFVKVARLYSQFLMSCDLNGVFSPSRVVLNDVKFFHKEKFISDMEICKTGYMKPGSMDACRRFCKHFNPTHYDELLEGEIDKLYALDGFMKRRMILNKRRYKQQIVFNGEDLKPDKRVLEEKTSNKERGDQLNEVNQFNREFKTGLAIHNPYRYKYDTSIKYPTNYDESVFETGMEHIYNVVDFTPVIRSEGVDFYSAGDVAIDKENAARIFELINPEQKEGMDLSKFLKN